jgi:Flp pilus assembly protein TadG
MYRRTTDHGDVRRRGGSITVELLLVLPILMAVLLGTFEFSMLAQVRQQLVLASREGARVAALGGTQADVTQATQQSLGGVLQNATIQVNIADGGGNPTPSGQPVSVLVSIQAGKAVPDLLTFIGYSISNQTLAAQTVMRKE